MRAATVVQVLQDLFYVLLHVLFYLWSLFKPHKHTSSSLRVSLAAHTLSRSVQTVYTDVHNPPWTVSSLSQWAGQHCSCTDITPRTTLRQHHKLRHYLDYLQSSANELFQWCWTDSAERNGNVGLTVSTLVTLLLALLSSELDSISCTSIRHRNK